MKVGIVSGGNKNSFLEMRELVNSISSDLLLFSLDNQVKNLGVMVVEEKNQVVDNYDEHPSDNLFKTNMKKKIKQQSRMVNQRLRKNKR